MEEQILAFVELMGGRGNEGCSAPVSGSGAGDGGPAEGGAVPEACGPSFPVAAAWLVLAGLEAGTDGVTSLFRWRPDGTYRRRAGAGAMRRQAEQLMAPIWRTDLPFGGVLG